MKTVGDFKKAGLVFVRGDGYRHKGGECQMLADSITLGWFDRGMDDAMSATITEFAWRENTGVKPEFMGLIDVKFSTGAALSGYDKNFLGWNKTGAALPIIEWRPSLNQHQNWPDNSRMDIIGQNGNDGLHYDNTAQRVEALAVNDKPILTQAMADASELPPVGAKAKVCIEKAGFDIDNGDLKFEGKVVTIRAAFANEEGEKIVAVENEDGNCACYIIECIESLDTRTDREKAIDAALSEWPASDKATLEIAYDFWRVGESTIYDW